MNGRLKNLNQRLAGMGKNLKKAHKQRASKAAALEAAESNASDGASNDATTESQEL